MKQESSPCPSVLSHNSIGLEYSFLLDNCISVFNWHGWPFYLRHGHTHLFLSKYVYSCVSGLCIGVILCNVTFSSII